MDLIGVLKAVGLITIGDVDWVLLISKHLYHRPSAGRSGTAGFESVTQLVIRAPCAVGDPHPCRLPSLGRTRECAPERGG
jgi:hypothetical protein